MTEENVFMDFVKMPLLALTLMIVGAIGVFFEIPLIIPPFAATLFMMYLREGSEFAQMKNIIGGHLIGFVCAFIHPFFIGYMGFIPDLFIKPVLIAISILIAGWLMIILRVQHPPAAATVFMFLTRESIEGEAVIVGLVPVSALIGFAIGLGLISAIGFFVGKLTKKGE